jgi:DnaJ-class molecular chaperone
MSELSNTAGNNIIARLSAEKRVVIACVRCHGAGEVAKEVTCHQCGGAGANYGDWEEICSVCGGIGTVEKEDAPCEFCDGLGEYDVPESVVIESDTILRTFMPEVKA